MEKLCVGQQRLGELYFVPRMVVHSEIAVAPRLAHDLLRKPGAAPLEFGVEFVKLMRENVYPYGEWLRVSSWNR